MTRRPGLPDPEPAGPGEESVWRYPRPPRLVADARLVEVRFGGEVVASTTGAYRVLETSHPPGYYLPPDDVRLDLTVAEPGSSMCEWKGRAAYWSIRVLGRLRGCSPLFRHDAPLSVLRAYRRGELRELVRSAGLEQIRVERHFPYRLAAFGPVNGERR